MRARRPPPLTRARAAGDPASRRWSVSAPGPRRGWHCSAISRSRFAGPAQLLQPLAFFALVTMLFPLCDLPGAVAAAPGGARGAVGGGAAGLAAGAGVPVPRRRAGRHARAVRALGTVAHGAAVRQDRRTLAAHRAAAGAHGPVAALSLGAPASALPGIIVVAVVLGSVTLSLIGCDRRRRSPSASSAAARCCRC